VPSGASPSEPTVRRRVLAWIRSTGAAALGVEKQEELAGREDQAYSCQSRISVYLCLLMLEFACSCSRLRVG
jgi:hypothetical protein